jgi:NTP pyrophosphatase (non-canonical NTP hydrolase)
MNYQLSVDRFTAIMSQITTERGRQDAKWGEQNHDFPKYYQILNEELGEASKAFLEKDFANLRVELIQCAAVMVAMLECGDRTGWFEPLEEPTPSQFDPRSGKDRRVAATERRDPRAGGRRTKLGYPPVASGERRTDVPNLVGRRLWSFSNRRKADRRRVEES